MKKFFGNWRFWMYFAVACVCAVLLMAILNIDKAIVFAVAIVAAMSLFVSYVFSKLFPETDDETTDDVAEKPADVSTEKFAETIPEKKIEMNQEVIKVDIGNVSHNDVDKALGVAFNNLTTLNNQVESYMEAKQLYQLKEKAVEEYYNKNLCSKE